MHDIAPYELWISEYNPVEDERSPFYQMEYETLEYTKQVYNYYIHPYWDDIGSETLYIKVLYADYDQGFTIIELIGEWNDTIHNDIMYLKRNVLDPMIESGIFHFILLAEHVFNFHGSDDSYYEEWKEDISDQDGSIHILNAQKHLVDEMRTFGIHQYVKIMTDEDLINWRKSTPAALFKLIVQH